MNGTYWKSLDERREALDMSYTALSERTGISLATLNRLLSGKADNPTLHSLQSVCAAIGVELIINGTIEVRSKRTPQELRERAAKEKAEKLVKLVQGTSALESQAVGLSAVRDMVSRTVHELLTGPSRKLWSS